MSSAKPTTTQESLDLRYLEPAQVKIFRTAEGRVRATITGERSIIAPRFLRAFPLGDPDRYISLREAEPGGKEVGLLRGWKHLDRESRALLQEELERRYLYATLERIISVEQYFGVRQCVFETDRGTREVTLRDMRENIVYMGGARILLTDAEGNRYDIPDVNALDDASRARLSQLL